MKFRHNGSTANWHFYLWESFLGGIVWWGIPRRKKTTQSIFLHDVPVRPVAFFHSLQAGVSISSRNVSKGLIPHPDSVIGQHPLNLSFSHLWDGRNYVYLAEISFGLQVKLHELYLQVHLEPTPPFLPTILSVSNLLYGLPIWLSGKESPCQCRRCRFDSWVGKILWRRKWQPIPVFLPGEF